jgi:hypothetical protein
LRHGLFGGNIAGRNAVKEVAGKRLANNFGVVGKVFGNESALDNLDALFLVEVLQRILVDERFLRIFEHHGAESDEVNGSFNGSGLADFLQVEDLHGAGDETFGFVSEQVLVELSVVDDGLDDQTTTSSASDVTGVGATAPHVQVVSGKLKKIYYKSF